MKDLDLGKPIEESLKEIGESKYFKKIANITSYLIPIYGDMKIHRYFSEKNNKLVDEEKSLSEDAKNRLERTVAESLTKNVSPLLDASLKYKENMDAINVIQNRKEELGNMQSINGALETLSYVAKYATLAGIGYALVNSAKAIYLAHFSINK